MRKTMIALAAMLLALTFCPAALARETMQVYLAKDALSVQQGQAMLALLSARYPHVDWALCAQAEDGKSLRTRILSDETPDVAICAPQEVLPFREMAQETASLSADGRRVQEQVVRACTDEAGMFMLPLLARHRKLAVREDALEKAHEAYMLDNVAHGVWYPTEFQQLLEALDAKGITPLELWPPEDSPDAMLALAQSVYGGAMLFEDGKTCIADNTPAAAGLNWLREMLDAGLFSMAESREAALSHFLTGQTAMFIDWTGGDGELPEGCAVKPYPSSAGLPVRSFDVVGVTALNTGSSLRAVMARSAAALLTGDEKALALLGPRGIFADGAVWLPCMRVTQEGQTLRRLLTDALRKTLDGEENANVLLRRTKAAMDTAYGQ